ncbi:hypothetical protein BpHYR1_030298 [Brachionus plicatilis]|uniref:Uncharacterized protein n=1 Tax=Brachionus plicatilis TaxID=10195 RepID=A0A3M7PNX4_BRAPC|nr:hypothetical protein BpHYR1_030298 [Brachionus plicatilis]
MVVLLKPKLLDAFIKGAEWAKIHNFTRPRMLTTKNMRILQKILLNIFTLRGNKIKQIMFNKVFLEFNFKKILFEYHFFISICVNFNI